MKIKKLIKEFEKLLPKYEMAFKNNYSYVRLTYDNLHRGICFAINIPDIYGLFGTGGYYEKLKSNNLYLFPTPDEGRDLKTRIDFLKSEIINLNKLLKNGYTDV